MVGNTFHNYYDLEALTNSGNNDDVDRIVSAILITQVSTLTFNENEVTGVPAWVSVGKKGNGHALQVLSLGAWTLTATKNHIHDNAGGILVVT
jgi:hypothetical protein